ncbi:methyltransferase [Siminovitchia terrae]|uniref:MerR family transcriptional regulator n=1 Tax=Siminovitchia terrae TaxID=1914933 RepID=A0A429XDL0_SIMTE|nr:MerR family transcriptional regulator [Siminovitchia terrae]RST61534.1 MerR family transcriptional regulator [Siminovitchia terrae]GIN97323.1 methyltransferase [Siminovitchia terrae]
MKIGEFSRKFNVTIDTVRHYIEMGLLIPTKEGAHYFFDSTCIADMELIVKLKRLQFTLQEIHKVLSLKRVTHFVDIQEIDYYLKVLIEKKQDLLKEKEKINRSLQLLDEKIESVHKINVRTAETGVPLLFLSMFYCPHCQEALHATDAFIKDQYVLKGSLRCTCGYEAAIKDGIIVTPNLSTLPQNEHYIYDQQMIEEVTPSFISLLEKGNQWIYKKMLRNDYSNKVILETNVETYVFPPKLLYSLSPSALYVFCGNKVEMLRKLKRKIEHFNPKLNVLYIVNSQLDLPFKHQSIDVVIDVLSFNDFSLFNDYLPLEKLSPYFKRETAIFGYSIFYEKNAQSNKRLWELYPNGHIQNIQSSFLGSNLTSGSFKLKESELLGYTENPGEYIDYHYKNEKLYCMAYAGARFQHV